MDVIIYSEAVASGRAAVYPINGKRWLVAESDSILSIEKPKRVILPFFRVGGTRDLAVGRIVAFVGAMAEIAYGNGKAVVAFREPDEVAIGFMIGEDGDLSDSGHALDWVPKSVYLDDDVMTCKFVLEE